jgi:hypothetical protein
LFKSLERGEHAFDLKMANPCQFRRRQVFPLNALAHAASAISRLLLCLGFMQ